MPTDQASGLRRLFTRAEPRLVGVGGVDPTPVALDLAATLAELGSRVLVVDRTRGEAGTRLGVPFRFELAHVIAGERSLEEVIVGANGIDVLPAARGLDELVLETSRIEQGWQRRLSDWLLASDRRYDVWLVNGLPPAGAQIDLLMAIEPTAAGVTGAYAQIKALANVGRAQRFGVVVHRAASEEAARATFASLAATARRFLSAELAYRGFVPAASSTRRDGRQTLLQLAEAMQPSPAPI
jgi:MinD-like ATPase involved in chromosome partitioning or flagellar assembly